MTEPQKNPAGTPKLVQHIGRTFIAGLVVVLPGAIIVFGIIWLFDLTDGILQPLVNFIFGRTIPGLGIIFTILLILIVGILTSNAIGNSVVRLGEYLVKRLPVLGQIYSGARQAMEAISIPGSFKGNFSKVIMVEYPRPGILTLGFVTNKIKDLNGSQFVSVFLPTAPFPYTGTWILATKDQVFETNMSFLQGVEMTLSWGIISPAQISIRRQPANAAK